ncbi:PREDICTED: mastermind-like protein 3 [Nanorana parkeri]|uniref:mastermind-like protein 3 n=1 Tax=Nanorana parkeri TaxID=125878 RepID=UPI0008549CE3|nr:PREDICTED: mastermind-like protein 3 [Nanorana parkeri]
MGDFAAPAASTNGGSSLCISSALGSGIGGAGTGIGVGSHSGNNTPPSTAAPNAPNNSSNVSIPKHSTVVERLRQRIEGCRRHHVNCESRYQQAQAEQLEMERRDTVNLYQRTLEQRAKKSGASQGGPTAGSTTGAGHNPHPAKQQPHDGELAGSGTIEHRNHTLIMLQEAVQKKLEGARSPLNGEQQNGICDGRYSPSAKRRRKDIQGMDTLNNISNMPLPSVSPLHQLDIKPHLPVTNSVTHSGGAEDMNKNGGQQDVKLAVNGSNELEENFNVINKEMKQEPLDDASVIDTSDTSLSNQNKLFSDINLNDQEWQELIDELANTVPEDDIQDLFNEDFEDKKDLDFSRPTAQTPIPQESASVKSDPSHSPFPHVSMGSPQVRPSSSGPSFSNVSSVSSIPSVSSAPSTIMLAGSPASCVVQSPQTPNPPHTPGQTSIRPGNGYVMTPTSSSGNGSVNLPSADLSPAEQLKQMAAQQQQRAKLIQQKQQHQQQQQHTNQPSNWSPVGPPSSPYGGTFGTEKPNSPMMYTQTFNNQNTIVPPIGNNPSKTTMNNYLPQSHMNMISQQTSNLNSNSISKTPNMLHYGNTKPLTHFNADMSQRMTPPIANQNKNAMLPYIQQQQQQQQQPPPMPPQMSHLSEEQKRMLIMKQKGLMNQQMGYGSLPNHGQEQSPVAMSRPAGAMQQSVPGATANPGGPGFITSQPQAAMMKQMLIEQRAQLHAMEQQKQQFLREQRQQQQHILAEQQLQQPHMNRQHLQQQRNPYGVQQVSQFQGSPQDIAVARNQAALQNMRASRMMAQNTGMMPMGPSQNPGTMPSGPLQPELGMAPYSNTSSSQPGIYAMNAGVNQIMQHPNQNLSMGHGAVQGPRQPSSGQALGMVGGFSQNMLVNSVMPQHQQMKGPVGQPMTRSQAPRLQNMMTSLPQSAQNWTQRGLQGMRTSGDMGAYNNGSVYSMQPGQSRISKQHFQQGMGQTVVDSTGAVRALNPAMSRQMMPSLPGQGTNQQRQMIPGMNPGVPNMTGFNQAPPQQLSTANFPQSNQSQAYDRNQDMSYSYTDSSTGPFPGLPDGTDLVDSIMSRGPGDEWMQELDELFGNQ